MWVSRGYHDAKRVISSRCRRRRGMGVFAGNGRQMQGPQVSFDCPRTGKKPKLLLAVSCEPTTSRLWLLHAFPGVGPDATARQARSLSRKACVRGPGREGQGSRGHLIGRARGHPSHPPSCRSRTGHEFQQSGCCWGGGGGPGGQRREQAREGEPVSLSVSESAKSI